MLKISVAAIAFALIALPAVAQTTTPATQNSGTGVTGQAGGKNGPPAKKVQPNTLANGQSQQNQAVRNQDVSKVPGKADSKSGPAVKPPKAQ